MRRTIARLLILPPALLVGGCLHAPMPWSADGKWLAYTVEVRPVDQVLKPGWIFRAGAASDAPRARTTITSYRLWATRADSGGSVLLAESPLPLTAPGWSPDGHALAFGRLVAEADGKARFEVVILEGAARRRVLASRPLAEIGAEAAGLPGQAIAWSPDGRYLAVPQLNPLGLAILRADNGRQINAIPGGFLPSWAPDGGRLAFFARGAGDTLQYLDSALGQPRHLLEVGQASQAPAWSRDGSSIVVVTRKSNAKGGEPPGDDADLVQVRVDTGASTRFGQLSHELNSVRDRPVKLVSIAFDREGENLFASTIVDGQTNQVTWYRPRENATYKKFAVVDFASPMGSLSLSPDGRTLAARVGPLDRLSAPALCDLDGNDPKARLIAPDDNARVEWIATLVDNARSILAGLPVTSADPKAPASTRVARPTLLPVLGEFEPNSEPALRLRRIGRIGRPLCDRPEAAGAADPEVAALLDEARLFFDYLREDYSGALAGIEALEARETAPERRLKLLTIRAQVFLNRGQVDRAGKTIAYLKSLEPGPTRRVEWTGGGYVVTPEPAAGQGWPDYLASRAQTIRAMLRDEGPEGHPNLDVPRSNLFPPQGRDPNFFPADRPFQEVVPDVLPGPRNRRGPPGGPRR